MSQSWKRRSKVSQRKKTIQSSRQKAMEGPVQKNGDIKAAQGKEDRVGSFLDHMVDGREFESLLKFKEINLDITTEIRKSMAEIAGVRNRPAICYMSNVVNSNIKSSRSINSTDDLPFSEMIASVPKEIKEIDVIIITGGGSGEQVSKFVEKLRRRFDSVYFIIPNIAMSAGTILATSGNEIVMGPNSYIGPIDPQVQAKNGEFIPAQALLTLVNDIKERGEEKLKVGQNPEWTDLQILTNIDSKELGNALSASNYSIELVETYLREYKFQTWKHHSDGRDVTEEEILTRI